MAAAKPFSFKRTGVLTEDLYADLKTHAEKEKSKREEIRNKWTNFGYDPKVAEAEAESLRREFREMTAQILSMKDPTQWRPPEPDPDDRMPDPASERMRNRSERRGHYEPCAVDARLMKKSLKATAHADTSAKVRFGDRVVANVKIEQGSILLYEGDAVRFFVGGQRTSPMLSLAATTMKKGDKATFYAPATFINMSGSDVHLSLEILDSFPADDVATALFPILTLEVTKVVDISGQLGPGSIWKRRIPGKMTTIERPTPNAEVRYSLTLYQPVQDESWTMDAATAEEGLGLNQEALKTAKVVLEKQEMLSPAPRPFSTVLNDDSDDDRRYAERLILEASSVGERCLVALAPKAAAAFVRGVLEEEMEVSFLIADVEVLSLRDHVDCVPERPGAVTKRVVQAALAVSTTTPRSTDRVTVRGVVRSALDNSVVACAYGGAVALSHADDRQQGAVWCLDDDGVATLSGGGNLVAPLCVGIEAAVKTMQVGEIADVCINASDLGFVRAPQASKPPDRPVPRDVVAFHYSHRVALNAVPEAGFSAPLVARFKLLRCEPVFPALDNRFDHVLLQKRRNPSASNTVLFSLDRARAALDDAGGLKAIGNGHFVKKSYARAARRYGDGIAAIDVGIDAARTAHRVGPAVFHTTGASAFDYLAKHDTAYQKSKNATEKNMKKEVADDPPVSEATSDDDDDDDDSAAGELETALEALRTTLRLNRAASDLKRCRYDSALRDCEAVLAVKPKDVKALYRSGLALIGLRCFGDARKRLEACLILDTDCTDARNGLRKIQEHERRHPPDFRSASTHRDDEKRRSKAAAKGTFGGFSHRRRQREIENDDDDKSTASSVETKPIPALPPMDRMKRDFEAALGGIDFSNSDLGDFNPLTATEITPLDADDDDFFTRSVKTRTDS